MHQIKALVDLVERQLMGNQIVDVDSTFHVPVDDFRDVCAASGAAKRSSLPDAAGDQLERSGGDFLAGAGDADNDADAPAAVGAFESLTHDIDIADALEAVIGAALRQVHEIGDEVTLNLLRVDEMRHPEFFGHFSPLRIEIDADDHVGPGQTGTLDHVEPDAAEAENDDLGAWLDLGRIDHRPDPGGDPAADIANLFERRVLADLCDGDLGQHREVREGRRAHVVVDLPAAHREPARAVRHHTLPLGGANRDAEIGLA